MTKVHSSVHLMVFQHGLMGQPSDLQRLSETIALNSQFVKSEDAEYILDTSGRRMKFILSDVNNSLALNLDGVMAGAQRLFDLVQEQISGSDNICAISMFGHSLGGLYLRGLIGLLEEAAVFKSVCPVCFMTFATPHLGSVHSVAGSPSTTDWVLGKLADLTVNLISSKTFQDLSLKSSTLRELSDPNGFAMKGLARFQRRTLYAVVNGDFKVPFESAAICRNNPYLFVPRSSWAPAEGCGQHILEWPQPQKMIRRNSSSDVASLKNPDEVNTVTEAQESMLNDLRKMDWRVYPVSFLETGWLGQRISHERVVGKRVPGLAFEGQDILDHAVSVEISDTVREGNDGSSSKPSKL